MYCLNNIKANFKDKMGIFQFAASFFPFNADWWLIKIVLVCLFCKKQGSFSVNGMKVKIWQDYSENISLNRLWFNQSTQPFYD